jgi:hypothetical protein
MTSLEPNVQELNPVFLVRAVQVALLLQGRQVAGHPVGRADSELRHDLPEGGLPARPLDEADQVAVNLGLPGRQVGRVVHPSPDGQDGLVKHGGLRPVVILNRLWRSGEWRWSVAT